MHIFSVFLCNFSSIKIQKSHLSLSGGHILRPRPQHVTDMRFFLYFAAEYVGIDRCNIDILFLVERRRAYAPHCCCFGRDFPVCGTDPHRSGCHRDLSFGRHHRGTLFSNPANARDIYVGGKRANPRRANNVLLIDLNRKYGGMVGSFAVAMCYYLPNLVSYNECEHGQGAAPLARRFATNNPRDAGCGSNKKIRKARTS